ncbi:hypothetical protein [Nonomuraea fuscirosea]|uniref:hypothetical protein n=1 Tax=Nonomuraea fuscirosea TaxID=1291556 RepID=UPI000D06C736|nr:hypothetical protein [Nonomuraea fuscirosea]
MMHAGGGALVAMLGWRALFLPGLLPTLPCDEPGTGRQPDLLGSLLLVASIGALVLAICHASTWGWTSRRILGAGTLAAGHDGDAVVVARSPSSCRAAGPVAVRPLAVGLADVAPLPTLFWRSRPPI